LAALLADHGAVQGKGKRAESRSKKEGGEEREESPCSSPRYGIDQINPSIFTILYVEIVS
jgi:hypothetical protein